MISVQSISDNLVSLPTFMLVCYSAASAINKTLPAYGLKHVYNTTMRKEHHALYVKGERIKLYCSVIYYIQCTCSDLRHETYNDFEVHVPTRYKIHILYRNRTGMRQNHNSHKIQLYNQSYVNCESVTRPCDFLPGCNDQPQNHKN